MNYEIQPSSTTRPIINANRKIVAYYIIKVAHIILKYDTTILATREIYVSPPLAANTKKGDATENNLVRPTATSTRGIQEEVSPLWTRWKIKAKVRRRSIGKTLIITNIGLTSSAKMGLELVLRRDEAGDDRVV